MQVTRPRLSASYRSKSHRYSACLSWHPPKRRSTMVRNHFQLRIASHREGFCALHLLRFTRNINHPLTISRELQRNHINPTESRMNESKTTAPADGLIAL